MRSERLVRVPFDSVPLQLPLFATPVRAGFPNPADDFLEAEIDLNDYLIRNRAATILLRVAGDSMVGAGIYEDDVVVVDCSLEARQHDVVVAEVEGAFTIKRFERHNGAVILRPENPAYQPLVFTPEMELSLVGVVTFTLHRHRGKRRVR
jgi:DNA polymerase V